MIPFVIPDAGTSGGQTARKTDVLAGGENKTAFGDLMAVPAGAVDGRAGSNKTVKNIASAREEGELPVPPVVLTDQQGADQEVNLAAPILPETPGTARRGADAVIVPHNSKAPAQGAVLRAANLTAEVDPARRGEQAEPLQAEKTDARPADIKDQRSSVAQSIVEGRIPQAAMPDAQKGRAAAGFATVASDVALPRQEFLPKPDKARTPVLDEKTGPIAPMSALPGEAPRQRREEPPHMIAASAAATPQSPRAPVKPPAVALLQVAAQPQGEINEKNVKVADGEFLMPSAPADRPTHTATGQGTVSAGTSPETARHAATQIATAVTSNQGKTTDIALNPEELGRVKLSITASDGVITLNVLAERPETQDLLRRHMDLLAQEFRQLGYTSISFSFGEQPDDARSETSRPDTPPETDVQDPSETPIIVPEQTRSGLDLRI